MRTLLRSIVALVLAVATLEVSARIHDYVTRGVPLWALHYTAPDLYAYDTTGVHGIPNAHDGKFRMNSLGFRGPELERERESIICFGASETFGPNESAGREFPRQLEADLNAGGPRHYQVVNAGIPGMRLEDLHLARILRITKPTYAIIYPTTGWVAWTDSQWNALHPTPSSKNPPRDTWGRVRILARVSTAIHQALPPVVQTEFQRREAMASAVALKARPTSRVPEANIPAFQRDMERTLDALVRAHVKPILVTHATRFGPQGRYQDAELINFLRYYPVFTVAGFFDAETRMNHVVKELGKRYHAPVVDAAEKVPPGPADFYDFFHFTDQGSAQIASLLARTVRAAHVVAIFMSYQSTSQPHSRDS